MQFDRGSGTTLSGGNGFNAGASIPSLGFRECSVSGWEFVLCLQLVSGLETRGGGGLWRTAGA